MYKNQRGKSNEALSQTEIGPHAMWTQLCDKWPTVAKIYVNNSKHLRWEQIEFRAAFFNERQNS